MAPPASDHDASAPKALYRNPSMARLAKNAFHSHSRQVAGNTVETAIFLVDIAPIVAHWARRLTTLRGRRVPTAERDMGSIPSDARPACERVFPASSDDNTICGRRERPRGCPSM